jgi:ribosomal RNA-processing protein 1
MEIDNEKLFAIDLADNEKKTRDLALRKIKNYIRTKSLTNPDGSFNQNEMIKIWKGFHYTMWMSDKMIIQVN